MTGIILCLTNTRIGYTIIPYKGILKEVIIIEEKKSCECCEKKTLRDGKHKKALLNRLKRIEGQVRGIESMIEQDAYCNDILIQSAAVNAAMNSFNKELLASHIRSCVVNNIRNGNDEIIDELVTTLQRLMK